MARLATQAIHRTSGLLFIPALIFCFSWVGHGQNSQQATSPVPAFFLDELPRLKDYRAGRVTRCPYFPPRLAPGKELQLLHLSEPGCLTHIWTTGNLESLWWKFYFDGEQTPSVEGTAAAIFNPQNSLSAVLRTLPTPLIQLPVNGHNSYLPMPFKKSARVVIRNDGAKAIEDTYFMFDYITQPGAHVPDARLVFRPGQDPEYFYEGQVPDTWPNIFATSERREHRQGIRSERQTARATAREGRETSLLTIDGSGIVDELELRTRSLDGLEIRIFYEGSDSPAVVSPAGRFFGELKSALVSPDPESGRYRCSFPMPFKHRYQVRVRNNSAQAVDVEASVVFRKFERLPNGYGYFFARHASGVAKAGESFHLFEAVGRGHFVGLFLYNVASPTRPVDHAGADFIYGDAETESPFAMRAIGGEDYFSASYFGDDYATPYVGASPDYMAGGQRYRFHLESPITFRKSISVDFAISLHNRYESVAFWYQDAPTAASEKQDIPWFCVGPFNGFQSRDDLLQARFPPEEGLEFDKTYPVVVKAHNGRDVERLARWRKVTACNGFLNFFPEYTRHEGGLNDFIIFDLTYAVTWLLSPRDQTATFLIGHDDALEVRVNGAIAAVLSTRPAFGRSQVKVQLKKGKNQILIKNSNTEHPAQYVWDGFSFMARDEGGHWFTSGDYTTEVAVTKRE